ncbi:MAG: cellulase family glycosylhydrolase [Planctomycetaceae bacterium]|nr:cellulase family glycosylhydrolase [Planctomycetaceae bacterium]
MRTFHFPLCLTLVFLTAVTCVAQKPPLPSMVVPDGLGYNIHFTDARPGELEMLAESGATIIRMDFGWDGTERQKGVYDFSAFERLTDSLEKHNIRPLYILDYSNRNYDQGLSPYSSEGRAAFAKWAAAAAVHFKDRGILWEMYNEPNIHFWKPEPKPEDYILLALEVGKALREAAPDELYIGPATSEIDLEFLEQCFKAGLLEYWDAVSVHPYRQRDPETVIPEYAKLRWMIDKYAPEGKHIPILSAEWGYSSVWGNYTDEIQGKMLPRQWLVNLACDIPISIWYDWHDDGRDPKEPEHHFGTTKFEYFRDRTPVYDPKPSYLAARTFCEVFRGYKYRKRLVLDEVKYQQTFPGPSEVFIFLFDNEATQGAKGNGVRLAVWTMSKEPKTVTIPCSPGKFKVVSHLGVELPDLIAEKDEVTVTISDSPIYLIPETRNELLWQISGQGPEFPLAVYISNGPRIGVAQKIPLMPQPRRVNPTPLTATRDRYKEVCQVYSASPLIFSTPIIENNELVVHIGNPGGEALTGELTFLEISGLKLKTDQSPIVLEENQLHTQVRFPIDGTVSIGKRLSFAMSPTEYPSATEYYQSGGTQRLSIIRQTIETFDNFSNYTAETLDANWGIFPDGDRNVESEQTLALGENGAVRVTYRFDDGWKFIRLAPKNDTLRNIDGQPQSLALRVNADGSGNTIRMRFRDSQGQTFQVNGGKMTDTGMQYFNFDLTGQNASHWGGPNDGVVHYPITFDSIIIDGTRSACGPYSIDVYPPVLVYAK